MFAMLFFNSPCHVCLMADIVVLLFLVLFGASLCFVLAFRHVKKCHCDRLKNEFDIQCAAQQQHIVFRHLEQWEKLFLEATPCTQNARNATLPSAEDLHSSLQTFDKSVEPKAKTVCPDLPDEITTLPQAFSELSSFTASESNGFIQEHAACAPHTDKQEAGRGGELLCLEKYNNCNYEANPRYCTFANSWSTPCREHSTCLYLCTVLLLRLVHET